MVVGETRSTGNEQQQFCRGVRVMSAFPGAELKKWIREECLRGYTGAPLPPHKRLRVLALFIEGTMEGMPPIKDWTCPTEGGWNEDGSEEGVALDVDGVVGKMQVLCDREVIAKRSKVVFRLCAIMGTDTAIAPSTISASFPFTISPTRRIASLDTDEASPFAQSVGEANERGLNIIGIQALRSTAELLFPKLQEATENDRETINDLRAQLREERAENAELRTRLRASEDNQIERTLKVRDHAFKQRLKERGAKMVLSTATMVISTWMARQKGDEGNARKQMGNGGGGGGGGGGFRALPQDAGGNGAGNGSSAEASEVGAVAGPHKHCATCTCTPEQVAADVKAARAAMEAQQAEQTRAQNDDEVLRRAARDDFDIDALFNIFATEVKPYAIELVQAFPVESQGLLFQAAQEHSDTGKVSPILIAGICDNFATNEQVTAILQKIRSGKGQAALASILKDHWLKREREKKEGQEFVDDLGTRSDRLSSGEALHLEPEISDNPEVEIEVHNPRFLTREEAAAHRSKQLGRGASTSQKVNATPTKREKPL